MSFRGTARILYEHALNYHRDSVYRAHIDPGLVADQRGPDVGIMDVCSGPGDGCSKGIEAGHSSAQAVASDNHLQFSFKQMNSPLSPWSLTCGVQSEKQKPGPGAMSLGPSD